MNMLVEPNGYSGTRVVQGFDRNLSKQESKTLELKMREILKKYLEHEKENYTKTYMAKINSI
jgi:hypothetical protein